jgi:CHAT domain-containing protein
LEQVIALYEQYRKGIQEESNRNAFFDQEQSIYDIAIDFAYTRLGNPQQALAYAELCRARSLLDVSRRGWELIHGPEAPDLHIKAGVQPRTIDEIRLELPHDVQLLEYAVLEDKLVIWLITKTGVESRVLQVHLAELNERIRRYLALVEQQPGKADHRWRANALELHDLLLQPIEALLDKRKLICIIPDKLLTRLPFGTLIARSSGRLLTEDYLLSYAASANLFLDSTENARRKEMSRMERLLAVGNPRFESQEFPELVNLPSAEKEAAGVASNYKNATLLTAARATKETVLREIKRADVVHLALHYVPAPWSPMSSRIPLATGQGRDGKSALQVYEIYALATLSPRLVVLSACQTRGEGYYGGEGAVGISRPFEAAGVPLVVASLWPVDSEATMELMLKFHHARKQLKYPTASALRSAQLEMLYDRGGYRHPYYWAAFVTVGGHTTY